MGAYIHRYTRMYTYTCMYHTLIKSALCTDTRHQQKPLLFSPSLQCHLPCQLFCTPAGNFKTSVSKLGGKKGTRTGPVRATVQLFQQKVGIVVSLPVQMHNKIQVICQMKLKVLHLHLLVWV